MRMFFQVNSTIKTKYFELFLELSALYYSPKSFLFFTHPNKFILRSILMILQVNPFNFFNPRLLDLEELA